MQADTGLRARVSFRIHRETRYPDDALGNLDRAGTVRGR